ncbi:MAG: hypothetical protein Q8P41_18855 [Pseudomonadota bacterium]|nr:hypothetical protein [Pseudomonadota bacterium]
MRIPALFALSLLGAGCVPEPAAPKEAAGPPDTCGVDMTTLSGSSWIHLKPQAQGDKPNPMARIRFDDAAGTLKAKYTAASLGDVYEYSCTIQGKLATCLEDDFHAEAWCKAWAATHDGVCDPAAVAAATGIPQAEFDKVAQKVNDEIKKLKPAERDMQKTADNSPNNKIRGKFQVALDKGKCQVTLLDKYQTMVGGQVNEFENVLGTAKFEKAKEDYIYESCKDVDSAWAPGADDTHSPVQTAGTIKFSAILQKAQKGAPECTYSADVYKDWVKSQTDVAATDDKKFGPRWDVQVPLAEAGKHAVYFDRYKTCGDKKEKIGLTCAVVRID